MVFIALILIQQQKAWCKKENREMTEMVEEEVNVDQRSKLYLIFDMMIDDFNKSIAQILHPQYNPQLLIKASE